MGPEHIKREVYNFYSNHPYPHIRSIFSKAHRQLMRRIISMTGYSDLNGLKILDAGCGTGEKAVYMALKGADVTAVDVNPNQISIAKSLAKKHNAKLNFVEHDLSTLDLNINFDLVLCLGVLHHTPDFYDSFVNVLKHVKTDGCVVIGLYNKYGRLKYRILRKAIRIINGNDPKRIMNFLLNSPFALPLRNASIETLYDRYAIPYESYHSLTEVKKFLENHGFCVSNIYPDQVLENDVLTQLDWFIKGKTFFMVAGIKKS